MRESAQQQTIGAREAQSILGISRAALHRLATAGKLKGKLQDVSGQRRAWRFRLRDVQELRVDGTALKRRAPRKWIRVAWERWYGRVPDGLTVIALDGDRKNLSPRNLALVPLEKRLSTVEALQPRGAVAQRRWSSEDLKILRREFPKGSTAELATRFNTTIRAVLGQTRRLGLRKDQGYLKQRARDAKSLPIGTERIDTTCDIVVIKVAMSGKPNEQWRRKHHLVWEQAHQRAVPPGWRVIFKDGNKRNFDPTNLELSHFTEISARAFANYQTYPAELRAAIKLNCAIQRDVQRRLSGASGPERSAGPTKRNRNGQRRWSPEMDEVLRHGYPSDPLESLIATLGVTLQSIRQRAQRLGLRRSPEAAITHARARAEQLLANGG